MRFMYWRCVSLFVIKNKEVFCSMMSLKEFREICKKIDEFKFKDTKDVF